MPAFHLRKEFLHLRADSEKARLWPGRDAHYTSLVSASSPSAQLIGP